MPMRFLVALFFITSTVSAKTVDKIVAIVNKDIILQSDLAELKSNIKKGVLFDLEYASLFDSNKLKTDEKTQVEYLISEQLFIDHAKQTGLYDKSKRQLDSEIEKIAKGNQLTVEQFKSEIIKQGVTYDEYKEFILKSLIRKRIIDSEITSRIEISESDIIQYLLQKGSSSFEPRYQYSISHIVVEGDENTSRVSDIIRKEGFDQALKYSENQDNKGFLGTFKDHELAKPFRTTVKTLKISEVSQPISMNGKIFFIRLDDKKRINELPDTPEVRKARLSIIQNSISTEVQAWIEEKRQTSHIEIKNLKEG
jgi:peptidyl-prolyl cis-trans isomerase SurA